MNFGTVEAATGPRLTGTLSFGNQVEGLGNLRVDYSNQLVERKGDNGGVSERRARTLSLRFPGYDALAVKVDSNPILAYGVEWETDDFVRTLVPGETGGGFRPPSADTPLPVRVVRYSTVLKGGKVVEHKEVVAEKQGDISTDYYSNTDRRSALAAEERGKLTLDILNQAYNLLRAADWQFRWGTRRSGDSATTIAGWQQPPQDAVSLFGDMVQRSFEQFDSLDYGKQVR